MATKAKESNVVGKEKKTNTKKTTTTNLIHKATTSNPTEKPVPNYLKPTISSSLVESHSINFIKNDAPKKTNINRRRSFDKPPSPSRLPKQTHPSPSSSSSSSSRQHKALVSPGPRKRSLSLPLKSSNHSKTIPQIPKEGKAHQPALFDKSIGKKSRSPSPSTTSTTTKEVHDDAFAFASAKSTNAETTTEGLCVETEPEVKEDINNRKENVEAGELEKVEKQEEDENKVEYDIPPHVESEHENENEHDHEVEESDQFHHVHVDPDEKLISTVPEVEAAKEEKHDEDENRNQEECSNINGTTPEINHSTTEEEEKLRLDTMIATLVLAMTLKIPTLVLYTHCTNPHNLSFHQIHLLPKLLKESKSINQLPQLHRFHSFPALTFCFFNPKLLSSITLFLLIE
ncbi:PREDICTED: uncharacterized protein LOC109344167 isoform X2 [Lupinus angustifolius]|uniref:uncharacterized protein LOC109344167 isoform X2 n=1 Tax=Lupinus angustifolius TaxID=3871 RepID=UPI00092E34F5|nr:PREDICTED: uncharacterized protein LOC109344167 isoform X2 [Lupinus angustifolius]